VLVMTKAKEYSLSEAIAVFTKEEDYLRVTCANDSYYEAADLDITCPPPFDYSLICIGGKIVHPDKPTPKGLPYVEIHLLAQIVNNHLMSEIYPSFIEGFENKVLEMRGYSNDLKKKKKIPPHIIKDMLKSNGFSFANNLGELAGVKYECIEVRVYKKNTKNPKTLTGSDYIKKLNQCKTRVESLVSSTNGIQAKTKLEYYADAKDELGEQLSERIFNIAWAQNVPDTWKAGGLTKQKRKKTTPVATED